jgi:hypothetical protein
VGLASRVGDEQAGRSLHGWPSRSPPRLAAALLPLLFSGVLCSAVTPPVTTGAVYVKHQAHSRAWLITALFVIAALVAWLLCFHSLSVLKQQRMIPDLRFYVRRQTLG